jgi:hypothetical protein
MLPHDETAFNANLKASVIRRTVAGKRSWEMAQEL